MTLSWPQSLFVRTAWLIAFALLVFSLIVWQATMWAVVVPTADLTAEVLADRAQAALFARRAGAPLPAGVSLSPSAPQEVTALVRGFAYGVYLERVRVALRSRLGAAEVVISHARAPAQVGIRMAGPGNEWLVLSIRLARPQAPLAVVIVLAATSLLILAAAAWFARRLTRPLAQLAFAAGQIAEGDLHLPEESSAPREVRALASALRSMSDRLVALNEERELMLAGISHDLRSPLARMRIAVELLDERNAVLTQQMVAEIEEMDRMIGLFLHYVRAGYREVPTSSSLDEVVREALVPLVDDGRLQMRYGAAQARLLNQTGIRHIVLNLVHNALEHGVPPVQVITREDAERVELTVSDAGSGIDPEQWDRALRPFDRLRAVPGMGHAGLGLALVDRLVRAGRGTLAPRRTVAGFEIRVSFPAKTESNS